MANTLRFVRADATPQSAERKSRRDDPRMASRMVGLDSVTAPDRVQGIILGVADDRGVRLEGGRAGAADGPARFRDYFGRLSAPQDLPAGAILQAGDLMPAEHTAETHARLAEVIGVLRERFPRARLVVVGGGFDHAYGAVLGLARGLPGPDATVGVLQVDARPQVRPFTGEPHSASATRRLLSEPAAHVTPSSLALWGLQRAYCASAHWQYLQQLGVAMWSQAQIPDGDQAAGQQLIGVLQGLASSTGAMALSLNLHAFSQGVAPGVSSPSPVGVPLPAVVAIAAHLSTLNVPTQLGIYELNPRFDQDGATARVAARVAWSYLTGLC